jgi:hypothetical protein
MGLIFGGYMKRRRLAVLCSAIFTAAILMLVGPGAIAAPTKGETFTVTCPGLGTVQVVVPGQAPFTPAFVVGTHQLLIPYRITGTATAPGQPPFRFEEVKKAPIPPDAVTCTFTGTFIEGDMIVTVTGTVVAVLRGTP